MQQNQCFKETVKECLDKTNIHFYSHNFSPFTTSEAMWGYWILGISKPNILIWKWALSDMIYLARCPVFYLNTLARCTTESELCCTCSPQLYMFHSWLGWLGCMLLPLVNLVGCTLQCTWHARQYNVNCTIYTIQWTMYIVHSTEYTVHCALNTQRKAKAGHCTVTVSNLGLPINRGLL